MEVDINDVIRAMKNNFARDIAEKDYQIALLTAQNEKLKREKAGDDEE